MRGHDGAHRTFETDGDRQSRALLQKLFIYLVVRRDSDMVARKDFIGDEQRFGQPPISREAAPGLTPDVRGRAL
jgi:hypothetical protein